MTYFRNTTNQTSMKTKLTWFLTLTLMTVVSIVQLHATEVKVISTTGTCAGATTCKGTIKLSLNVSAGPLKLELYQGSRVLSTRSFSVGSFEYTFDKLCSGNYGVRYYPEQFPSCTKVIDPIKVEDDPGFSVNIIDFDNSTVKVSASKDGAYRYSWSNDNKVSWTVGPPALNLASSGGANGIVFVKVEDLQTGCTVIKQINKCNNYNDTGSRQNDLSVEVQPLSDPSKFKLIARLKQNGELYKVDDQLYAVKWYGKANKEIGYGTELIVDKKDLVTNELGSFVSVTAENSCSAEVRLKLIRIECSKLDANALKNFFVKSVEPYCGVLAGKITIKSKDELQNNYLPVFANTEWLKIFVDGIERANNLNDFSFTSGGKHQIRIEILDCKYVFDVDIPIFTPTMLFAGVAKQNDVGQPSLCQYDITCNGVKKRITQPVIQDQQSESALNGNCGYEIYCNLDGITRYVGKDEYGFKEIPAGMYKFVLLGAKEQAIANQNFLLATTLSRELDFVNKLSDCHKIKYCPITFKRISSDHPFIRINRTEHCEDGCTKIRCGLFGSGDEYSSCTYTSYRERNCCAEDRRRALKDLCNTYQELVRLNALNSFYVAQPKFRDSELERLLINYSSPSFFNDPRMNCAVIHYCLTDFKLMQLEDDRNDDLFKPLDYVDCNQNVAVGPVEFTINLGTVGNNIENIANKIKKNALTICAACTQWPSSVLDALKSRFKNLKGATRCPTWKKSGKKGTAFIGINIAENEDVPIGGLKAPVATIKSIIADDLDFIANASYDVNTEELLNHVFTDTTSAQTLDRFSTIYSAGEVSPKLLFKADNKQQYYNYSHKIIPIEHVEQKGIEHLIEDWDEKSDYFVRKTVNHKEYLITKEDTSSLWALPLVSDSLLSIEHFSRYDSLIYVAGYYKGLLYLGGKPIDTLHNYNRTNLFFLQLNKAGRVVDISLTENIDTTGGLAFSENKAGVVYLAAHAQGDTINVKSIKKQMPQTGSVFMLRYSDETKLQFSNAIGNSGTSFVAGVALAPGATNVTLALFGGGIASLQNGFPTMTLGSNNLNLLQFGTNGVFSSAKSTNAAHLLPRKFAMSYGAGNGLLLGLTYDQTTVVFGDTLVNEGNQDVAILKYAQNGTLAWGEVYGTSENESVSKMMYDPKGIAYFAGEISGVQDARLIGNYIFSDTTKTANQRVYLSYLIDTLSTTNTPQLISTPNSIEIVKNTSAVDLVQSLGVYPNPFTNQATVVYNASEAGTYQLTVLNEVGNLVENQQVELGVGYNSKILSTQHYIPGFYYLTLRNSSGKIIGAQKLIKE